MNKYEPIFSFLSGRKVAPITAAVADLDRLVGGGLPPSAAKYRAWWANDRTHVQAKAWMDAGFLVSEVVLGSHVVFDHV